MHELQALIPLVIAGTLAALVASVGLKADPGDLLYLFRRPGELARAVLAVNVIVPVAAVLIVSMFPLSTVSRAGILLMAISPVPPLVPGKALKLSGHQPYAYGLYLALALLAVPVVPISLAVLSQIYGKDYSAPVAGIVKNVALTVLVPLLVGIAVRRLAPAFAEKAAPILYGLAMVLLLVAFVPVLITVWPAISSLIGDGTFIAIALCVLVALAAGHLLGGPDPQDRAALAVTAATRHPGIAIMIASANDFEPKVKAAILAFLLGGLVVGLPYQQWIKRRTPPAAVLADS